MPQTYFSKLVMLLLAGLLALGSGVVHAQLNVSPPAKITAMPGETITVPLNLINPVAKAIDAFGLRLLFPGALLDYDTVQTAGTLTNGWLVVNGNQTGANEVTLGGFHIAATTASGVLLNLKFTVKPGATGKDSLKLGNFTDDLAGATTTNGLFEIFAGTIFTAILNGDQEIPPISTPGQGQITATLLNDQLKITGSFSNLSSDFNAAVRGGSHLHLAPAGRNGGIQIELAATVNADQRSGSFVEANNTFTLTNDLVTALNDRKLYANIHTQTYPGGEIRGQLAPEANAFYRANLAGSNEVPVVSSTGNGGVLLELRGAELTVSGSFKELTSNFNPNIAGGAHVHLAPAGRNGGIQFGLATVQDADARGGVFEAAANKFTLPPEHLTALQTRKLYVNVHTTAFGGGEIRGQVLPQTANAFRAHLSGGNEVPAVATNGVGALAFELAGNQLTVSGSFNSLTGNFNANIAGGAHLHLAPVGQNGGIQVPLAPVLDADSRGGIFEAASNIITLTEAQTTALRTRKLYANIHTLFVASGEIRGQVLPENYSFFSAVLSGKNEVQPNTSTATGGVIAELSGTRMSLTGSFNNLTSDFNPNIAGGAHLHGALAGQNGAVLIMIVPALAANSRSGIFEAAVNTFALTADQTTALRTGGLYANVHTQIFPGGEVRGQLLSDPNRFPNATTTTSPASGDTVNIAGSGATLFQAAWNTATDPDNHLVVYIWQVASDRQFNALLVNRNTNTATSYSARYSAIDSILASAGVAVGASVKLYHRANTSDGSLQTAGTADSLIVTRGGITISIAQARATANTTTVTVEGIVTRVLGRFTRLQDATAGIVAFESTGAFRTAVDSGRVREGDLLRITGVLTEFNSLKQFSPITSFQVLSRTNPLPEPQKVNLAEVKNNGEAYESELIRVDTLTINRAGDARFVVNKTYQITDASDNSNAVAFRTPAGTDTRIGNRDIPNVFNFVGVLGQFSSTNPAVGYQLQPVQISDIEPLITAVAEREENLPASFALHGNYPNPFNPATIIRYDLPRSVPVKLVIYNTLGKKIRTLIYGLETAGFKSVTWDGMNEAGVRVASGVYLYRLEAGDFTAKRSLTLMK